MAKPPPIIALNLGAQTIRVARFQEQPKGELALCDYYAREALIDPANERIDQDEFASLREIVSELQIKGRDVNYAVAAQSVFTRFVKLPVIEEEKLERIIAFEAQQNVPFPLSDVVWDYQLVGGRLGEQAQVVFVATKADLVNDINQAVEQTGLRTAIVDVAPMALCNAFRYNYSDLSGCSLLIDLGARTTSLLFIEPEKIFSRSIPVGGSAITAAIAREFNEPFAAAELRKKRAAFVRLGGAATEPGDSEVARVSKLIASTMTRLYAEVVRSIGHYRAQQQGSAPDRVFLCGAAAGTPCLPEFFREKLQIPIEFFDPLRNVNVRQSAAADEVMHSAHQLGEVVGLALRAVNACPIELNLRPEIVVRRQELAKRRPFLIGAAAILTITLLAWVFYYVQAARTAHAATEKIARLNAPMRVVETKVNNLRRQAAELDAVGDPITSAINDRFQWVQLLEDLNSRLPRENIWITELIPLSGGKPIGVDEKRAGEISQDVVQAPAAKGQSLAINGLLLRGLYLFNQRQQEVVVDYFKNLVGSPFFSVDPINQARAIKSTIPNNTDWAFPYELRLDLKKPVKLP